MESVWKSLFSGLESASGQGVNSWNSHLDLIRYHIRGWVPEWLKGPVLKTGRG